MDKGSDSKCRAVSAKLGPPFTVSKASFLESVALHDIGILIVLSAHFTDEKNGGTEGNSPGDPPWGTGL